MNGNNTKWVTFPQKRYMPMGTFICAWYYLCGISEGEFERNGIQPVADMKIRPYGSDFNTDVIEVKKGNYIECSEGTMFIPIKYVNSIRQYSEYLESFQDEDIWNNGTAGVFKVGRDMPAGEYVISLSCDMSSSKNIIKDLGSSKADAVISNSFYEGWTLINASETKYKALKKSSNAKAISLFGDVKKIKKEGYVSKNAFSNNYKEFHGDIATLVTLKKGQWVFWNSTVSVRVFPSPEKFALNKEKKVLKKGEEFTLKLKKMVPAGAYCNVEYSSSNPKVATVDEYGTVKAKKVGTTVITVQSVIKKDVKATCVITVPSNKQPTLTPTKKLTLTLTKKPTATPIQTPTMVLSVTPTMVPSVTPTMVSSVTPTIVPSVTPTMVPSVTPTVGPSVTPTVTLGTTPTVQITPSTGIMITVAPTPTTEQGSYVETYAIENSIPYENRSDME